MKKNKVDWQDIIKMLIFAKFRKFGNVILISNFLYKFFQNIEKDSKNVQKELKTQIKHQPVQALAFSFVIGWILAGLFQKKKR